MNARFFDRIAGLEREHASFAIATVVAREAPVSSHLGDRALVFADGHMEGFVGGSCSRDIVRRQALGAIHNRQPVLLQIRPDTCAARGAGSPADVQGAVADANTERVIIPMSCSSEGAVDVYIEPRLPRRQLLVVGFTPVAEAVARIANALDYGVTRVVIDAELRDLPSAPEIATLTLTGLRAYIDALDGQARAALVAIVASQGHYDELALEALQAYDIAFLGLVASRRRAASVLGVLAQQGVTSERLAMIRFPVGLDIGARSPGEVAVSILAEIISNTPRPIGLAVAEPAPAVRATAIDPVCTMLVETASALYHIEHAGRTVYFCCAGCRASFAADPPRYLSTSNA